MGLLVEGKWTTEDTRPNADDGRYLRAASGIRHRVTADGSSGFKAEKGRYHLFASWSCPWAHRTMILRRLKGLEGVISLSVAEGGLMERGWKFADLSDALPETGKRPGFLHEVYTRAEPAYSGRVTVPVLWDKERKTIVNNESREIIRMLDMEFDEFGDHRRNFLPRDLAPQVEETIDAIYEPINNGVYKSGFARSQEAYEAAVTALFEALDRWEGVLGRQRYLCGDELTEADWCLFPTLLRFDLVYYSHFKCNLRRIADYPNLWNYTKELYQVPGVAEVCNLDQIKAGYYRGQEWVNPTRIVPKGPIIDFSTPHDRATRRYAS